MNIYGLSHRMRLHLIKHIHRLAIITLLLILGFSSLAVTTVDVRAATSPVSINMVYYGPHSTAIDEAIISTHPEFLIGSSSLGPMKGSADINKFTAAGIKYFEYLTGGYERKFPKGLPVDLQSNLDFIEAVASAGAYGIFFDEVSDGIWFTPDYNYLQQIASKAHDLGLKVVFNTGVNDWIDQLMDYCDYIGSTEQWSNAPLTASQQKWASRTWLLRREGIDDAVTAANLTIGAWDKGVLAAYATPSLSTLPSWLPSYISLISSHAPLSPAPAVTLLSTDTSPTNTSPIPMAATFSKAVTGFEVGEITVGNGTASNFVAVSATIYTFNVTPTADGAVTVNIAAGVAQDVALNNNTAASQFSIIYNSTALTVTLSSTITSPTNTSPIPMAAIFSKAVTGFEVGDITAGNGTVSNFIAVSATIYIFNVTPTAEGTVTVNIAAGVAQDAALNNNTAAAQLSIIYDSTAPTLTLGSTSTSPTNTSPIPMAAIFSEVVTGFEVGDITVGNGTVSNFVALSGKVYTFNITTTGEGTATVNIAGGVAQDAATNNTTAAQFSIIYDSTAPTVTLSSTSSSSTNTSPIPMTATFSEAVTDFAAGDITVGNGTVSNFVTASNTVYSFDVTPTAEGTVTVNIAAGVAQDVALNNNTAAAQFSITYDSTAPTVTLSSSSSSSTNTSPIPMTATFSEAVTGFATEDITVDNGTVSNFVAVSNTVYSFDVTPTAEGTVTVNIAAGVAQDVALNNNTAAAQFSKQYSEKTGETGGCSSGSAKAATSSTALAIGWGTVGLCWGGGYYMVRRIRLRASKKEVR